MKSVMLITLLAIAIPSHASERSCENLLAESLPSRVAALRLFFEQAQESLKSKKHLHPQDNGQVGLGRNAVKSTVGAWQKDVEDSEIHSLALKSTEASLRSAWANSGPYSLEELQSKTKDWPLNIELIHLLTEFLDKTSPGNLEKVQFIASTFNYASSERISNPQMITFAQKLWSRGHSAELRVGTMVFGIFRDESPRLWGGDLPDAEANSRLGFRLFGGGNAIEKVDRVMTRIAALLAQADYVNDANSTFKKLVFLTLSNRTFEDELRKIEHMVSSSNPFTPGEIGQGAWQRINKSRLDSARKAIDRICIGLPAFEESVESEED